MTDQQFNELLNRLDALGAKMGAMGPEVWSVLKTQALIDSCTYTAVFAAGGYGIYRLFKDVYRRLQQDFEDNHGMLEDTTLLLSIAVGALTSILTLAFLIVI